jgi:hypothetical protein
MKTVTIALLATFVLAAPVAAHRNGNDMLKDAVVHDLEKVKRQFKMIVQQDGAGNTAQTSSTAATSSSGSTVTPGDSPIILSPPLLR